MIERMIAATTSHDNTVSKRFRLLVVGHFLVASLPLLMPLVSLDLAWLPVVFFTLTVPVLATLMLLAFWVGLGGGHLVVRLLGGVAGAWYIGLTTHTGVLLLTEPWPGVWEVVGGSLFFGQYEIAAVVILGIGFFVYRRFAELKKVEERPDNNTEPEWRRYSLLEVFVVMSLTAVALASIQLSRDRVPLHLNVVNATLVALMSYAAFFVNAIYVARATLGRPPILPKMVMSLVIAFLLGITMGIVARDDQLNWWLVPANGVTFVVATLILVASLLVVRSAGYRLVPRERRDEGPSQVGPLG